MSAQPQPRPELLLAPRNATEDAILAAARASLDHDAFETITMETIARRAFVSRTSVYFYFPNKRAVVDRLIQIAFTEAHAAAAPYFEGQGEPRMELRLALARVVACVNRHANVLLLAAHLSDREDQLPSEWEPYLRRFVASAARRIRRDQERGVAPGDIPAKLAAQALCAMVERHVTTEVMKGGANADESIRVLSELWWRGVYSRPA